jgi:hypothetical protein
MKRLISLVLVLSLVMALAACAEGKVYDVVYLVDGKPGWQKKKCRRHCLDRQYDGGIVSYYPSYAAGASASSTSYP